MNDSPHLKYEVLQDTNYILRYYWYEVSQFSRKVLEFCFEGENFYYYVQSWNDVCRSRNTFREKTDTFLDAFFSYYSIDKLVARQNNARCTLYF